MCEALKEFSPQLTPDRVPKVLKALDHLHVCAGQPDSHFIEMVQAKKERILSSHGETVAFLDSSPLELNGITYQVSNQFTKCDSCKRYWNSIHAMHSRWTRKCSPTSIPVSSHINERYLNTPQKASKIANLRNKVHTSKEEIKEANKTFGETIDMDFIQISLTSWRKIKTQLRLILKCC